ncbi:Uncharacterised protein [Zhongshania aliphaticivorans]|uniref:Uncharacterized protein n=1 Tax=Zhongshania aliphaticivorans TaxID=1470434 RepID=A0A5S9NI80_9GAMM|nr:Uncharacterised protein [Zhongshania aliphaticivorans]CAA0120544.1 Uncharacterised protein [Zhongshania aliphaticivorans]
MYSVLAYTVVLKSVRSLLILLKKINGLEQLITL